MSRVRVDIVSSPGIPARRHRVFSGSGGMRSCLIMKLAPLNSAVRAVPLRPGQKLTGVGQAIGMTGNRRVGQRPGMVAVIRRVPDSGPGQKLIGNNRRAGITGNPRVDQRPGMVSIIRRLPDLEPAQKLTGDRRRANVAGIRRAGQRREMAIIRRVLDAVFPIVPPCRDDACGVNT